MHINSIESFIQQSPAASQWQKIGIKHHHGIVTPLFSLHSTLSCGIGEYPDLIPLITWCKQIGLDIIQLLPLNDTGLDSSPYGALSANALNPIHLGLSSLPFVDKTQELQQQIADLQKLTQSQRISYPDLIKQKDAFLRSYYLSNAPLFVENQEYIDFTIQHQMWLDDYCVFKALKVLNGWKSWEEWPEELKNPTSTFLASLPPEIQTEAAYHRFVQFLCFKQFADVKAHADQVGILLKGDIPILINKESVDVWRWRHLFDLSLTAGSPPDMYAEEGQNWGFPLYNWNEHEKNGHHWWAERLGVARHLYHLFRLDHVVGFFRIWAIPFGKKATEGHFIPSDEKQWIPQGEGIMRMMLHHSPLLSIAEDLGVVPPTVRECLKNLGISGTKVMRWERNWETDKEYIDPKNYSPISMTTVSTHDSETLQQWWKNAPDEAQLFAKTQNWKYEPDLKLDQRRQILSLSHHSGSFFHINLLQEYLALIPKMTWPDPNDERINVPSLISDVNWTYRFRPSIDEIIQNNELKQAIKELIH